MIVQVSPKRSRALKLEAGTGFRKHVRLRPQGLQLAAPIKFRVDLGYVKGQLKNGYRDMACKVQR